MGGADTQFQSIEEPVSLTNAEFIDAIFQHLPSDAEPVLCSFYGDPQELWRVWTAQAVSDLSSKNNNFFAVGSFYRKDGMLRAVASQGAAAHVILLDDVGTKASIESIAKLAPSYLIETSPNNFQAGYILDEPITNKLEADALLRMVIAAGLSDKSATGSTTRWARLPNGVNGKAKHRGADGKPFQCRLKEWRPQARYTPQRIIEGLNLQQPQKSLSERAKATPPSQIADDRKASFGTTALQQEVIAVSSTPEGARNARLFEAAIKCASLEAGGCIDGKQAQAALINAAQSAGLTKTEAIATIKSAWRIGEQNPRAPQNRQLNTDQASRRQKMHDRNSKITAASLDDEDNEILRPTKANVKASDDDANRKTTEELLEIAAGFETYCDLSGEAYATLRELDGVITAPLASRIVKDILVTEYFERRNKLAAETQVKLVIELLSAKARRSGRRRKVNLRVGEHNGFIYLDLGKKFVEISQDGWKIVCEAPIPFRRPPSMQPLPEPTRGGSIKQLNKFLNIATEQDFQLVVAFLNAALRPTGPYPILCVTGEGGSAKSSLCELLARLIDPQSGHKLKIGNSEDQTFVLGENRWLLDFDNLSGVSADASDTLCRIATGASLAKRKLYSDSDQHLSTISRPIIVNGIDSIATRNDFADRAIVIALRRIPEEERRPEEEIRNEFVTAHPAILGALLDGIVEGLRRCSTVKLSKLPRMADFARWAVACETAHWPNGGFEKAYFANAVIAGDDVVANDEVAQALIEFMDRRSEWSGTAAELKTELEANLPDRVVNDKLLWPRTAVAMGKRLNRVQTALRRYGIEIDRTRECGGGRVRTITIRRSEPDTFQPDAAARTAIDEAGTNKVADRDKRDKYELSHLSLSKSNENNKIEGGGTGGTNKSPKTLPAPAKEWRIEL
jgi:energy-coupling factor transporter ATP-binding protein EcfA2